MSTIIETSTDQLIHELIVQQRAVERATERADAVRAQLVERLGVDGRAESDEAKVAVVETTTRVLDVDALQAVASKGLFYKLTKRVVDNTAFKALDALGQIPPSVQEIVTEKQSKPHLRLTLKVR